LQAAASYATAAFAGIAGGWAFALIWARVAPLSVQGQFWSTMTSVASGMLNAEHSREFVDLYRRLGVALCRYLGRNLGGLLLASLPLIALAGVFSASVFEPWPRQASWKLVFLGMATLGAVGAMARRWRT
jgi:hypothetical protein